MKILKSAQFILSMQEIINRRKELAIKLLEWHGGQSSPLYSVGSTWYAGKTVSSDIINSAIREIQDNIDKKVNYPETISEETVSELKDLKNRLQQELEIQQQIENYSKQLKNEESFLKNN